MFHSKANNLTKWQIFFPCYQIFTNWSKRNTENSLNFFVVVGTIKEFRVFLLYNSGTMKNQNHKWYCFLWYSLDPLGFEGNKERQVEKKTNPKRWLPWLIIKNGIFFFLFGKFFVNNNNNNNSSMNFRGSFSGP